MSSKLVAASAEREDRRARHTLTRPLSRMLKTLMQQGDAVKSAWLRGVGEGEDGEIDDTHLSSHCTKESCITYSGQSARPKIAWCWPACIKIVAIWNCEKQIQ